ncbi:MAG: class I SAM-dependent methyltransferase [Cyanobacteria bacterium J06621_8]
MTAQSRYTKYDTWAWLYNLTMGSTYAAEQLTILEKVLLPLLPKSQHILDLCCGTGQLSMLLSRQGYRVTGLDGSEQMLKYAQENSGLSDAQADFILGDARSFSLSTPVDAVISTSASLNHIMSPEELTSVFHQVNQVLKPGGIFWFDVNHHEQMTKWWRDRLTEGEIKSTYAWGIVPHYDPEARRGAFQVRLYQEIKNPKFNPIQSLKNIAYRILALQRFIGLRLKVLNKFDTWQPNWDYSELDYPVRGHSASEIRQSLEESDFTNISVLTLDGAELDENHSAYFLAYKHL